TTGGWAGDKRFRMSVGGRIPGLLCREARTANGMPGSIPQRPARDPSDVRRASMTPNSLPENFRQLILELVKEQVGLREFTEMQTRLGDDGIINAFMAQAAQSKPLPQKPKPERTPWWTWPIMVLECIPVIGDLMRAVVSFGRAAKEHKEFSDPVLGCGWALIWCFIGFCFLGLAVLGWCCR